MGIMAEGLGTVFVLAGNYNDRDADAYPGKCVPDVPGGLLVGAVDRDGVASGQTPTNEDPDVSAMGEEEQTGTSFGKSGIGA